MHGRSVAQFGNCELRTIIGFSLSLICGFVSTLIRFRRRPLGEATGSSSAIPRLECMQLNSVLATPSCVLGLDEDLQSVHVFDFDNLFAWQCNFSQSLHCTIFLLKFIYASDWLANGRSTFFILVASISNFDLHCRCTKLVQLLSFFEPEHAVYFIHAWLKHSSLATCLSCIVSR